MARSCGGGGFRVISERLLENSRLLRLSAGSPSSLTDCPYGLHQSRHTQMIIPSSACLVVLYSHQEGRTQDSKSGMDEPHAIKMDVDPQAPESGIFIEAQMQQFVLPLRCVSQVFRLYFMMPETHSPLFLIGQNKYKAATVFQKKTKGVFARHT